MPYRFVDHTADIGLEVHAPTLARLFEEAALALTSVLCGAGPVEPRRQLSVSLSAPSVEQLLVDWLTELIGRFDVEAWLTAGAEVTLTRDAGRCGRDALALGEALDPARHPAGLGVKGITYHRLSVRQTPEGWQATVVLDV